ncbi:GroES molecular chaperone protein [Stenotrophomonas phage vB_SmaS-DLP_6]|nr:GroES molecular chaperone protein [Stenotrophomonas phage vB_SmaS-DLP_6]
MTQYAPFNTFVVVKKIAASSTTQGGIILSTASEADRCEVIAANELVNFVKTGDQLLIRWSQALKIDDTTYAVDAKDIVAKVQ